jgi:hypothetical protein
MKPMNPVIMFSTALLLVACSGGDGEGGTGSQDSMTGIHAEAKPAGAGNTVAAKVMTPGEVIQAYLRATQSGSVEEIFSYVHNGDEMIKNATAAEIAGIEDGMTEMRSMMKARGGIADIRIVDEQIRGDRAMVSLEMVFGTGEQEKNTTELIKLNNRWLINQ